MHLHLDQHSLADRCHRPGAGRLARRIEDACAGRELVLCCEGQAKAEKSGSAGDDDTGDSHGVLL